MKFFKNYKYNFTNPEKHIAPLYSLYTGLALGESFVVFLALTALQMVTIIIVKVLKVKHIKKERVIDVITHILENLNFPFPYKDWDVEHQSSVDDYKQKLKEVNKEMAWSFSINIFFNTLMFIPFWWTGIILLSDILNCNFCVF